MSDCASPDQACVSGSSGSGTGFSVAGLRADVGYRSDHRGSCQTGDLSLVGERRGTAGVSPGGTCFMASDVKTKYFVGRSDPRENANTSRRRLVGTSFTNTDSFSLINTGGESQEILLSDKKSANFAVVFVSWPDFKMLNRCGTHSCFIGGLTVHERILRPSVVGSRHDAFANP